MSDNKEFEGIDKASDEIVEETMREIYNELHGSSEKKESGEGLEIKADEEQKEKSSQESSKDSQEVHQDVKETEADDKASGEDVSDDDLHADDDDSEEVDDAYDDEDLYDDEEDESYVDDEDESYVDEEDESDAEDDMDEDAGLKKHRRKKKALIVLGAFIGVLAAAYLGISVFFMSHFYYDTSINGTDFSMKTVSQVEAQMEKEVSNYKLTLQESDGGTEDIMGSDISIEYVKGDNLEKLLKKQNPFLWVSAFWNKPEIEASVGVKYDDKKLADVITALTCMKPEEQVAPVSATPEFQGAQFEVKDEVIGTQIDTENFQKNVETAINGFNSTLDMTKSGCYVVPKFTSKSPEVTAAKDAMNSYLGANITYDFNPYTEVVDATVISQWVTVDGDMNVTFNTDAVNAYIQGLADKYNTVGKDRSFTTAYGSVVTISGGSYGWKIDQEAEYAALTANIQNAETVTRAPAYSQTAVSHEGNDFGNTYCEVDLSNQNVWFFQDGQVVLDTPVVTGNSSAGNGTPQGVYPLAYKQRDQVLRGKKLPGGGYEYESPVSYWMPFNGGIGLHDAPWRGSFGGSIYATNGSHGCVNMPPSAAATLYDYVDSGTPIVCHY